MTDTPTQAERDALARRLAAAEAAGAGELDHDQWLDEGDDE